MEQSDESIQWELKIKLQVTWCYTFDHEDAPQANNLEAVSDADWILDITKFETLFSG